MSRAQVLGIMGTDTVQAGAVQGISNPWRTESFQGRSGKLYEVMYYYTAVRIRDDVVGEDELTPIVLTNGKLVGWGRTFFTRVKKLEIRAR
jgi:hypothetical protein